MKNGIRIKVEKKNDDIFTLKGVLVLANEYLKSRGIRNPEADSEFLLSSMLQISRNELYINFNRELSEDQLCKYKKLIQKRGKKYPVDYIMGCSHFMGLEFEVSPDTLIPRPETELLVETTLESVKNKKQAKILEIGAGCGNIAVSLAKFSDCRVAAIERDSGALEVAKRNASRHGVSDKIEFIQGNMFNPLGNGFKKKFDCLVSNPPYVKVSEYAAIPDEVKKEPKSALLAGKDGLKYIGMILRKGRQYIQNGGMIFMEIGYSQKRDVESLVKNNGFRSYRFIKDYSNIDRIIAVEVGER